MLESGLIAIMQRYLVPGGPGLHKNPLETIRRCGMLVLLALGCGTSASWAADSLLPHAAEYKVKISVLGGRLNTELRQTDDGFVARHSLAPSGFSKLIANGRVSEVAEFGVDERGVFPISYQTDDTLDKDEVHARVRFDWEADEAVGTVNDQELVRALTELTHDRISIQYALMHDLLNGGLDSEYRMFEVDKLKELKVRSMGTRKVKVPAGTFEAIGIQHQAENSSRTTTLWCVERLGYLPVMIEQHRKGKLRVRASLREYTPFALSAENDGEL